MCDACTEAAYERGDYLMDVLQEIADRHMAAWTPPRLASGGALCEACCDWWPCITFMTAMEAINNVR